MPDDHSELVPLLPIPNRTVKRLSANDSADTRVKVGHCQAISQVNPLQFCRGFSFLWIRLVTLIFTPSGLSESIKK